MTMLSRQRRRVRIATVVAMAIVLGRPAQVLAQGDAARPVVRWAPLTALVEREASRLARASASAGQFQPGNQPSGGPNCTKRKSALIGAIIGGVTTAVFVAQAATNRRAGTAGPGADVVAIEIAIGAGVGALAGAAACGG